MTRRWLIVLCAAVALVGIPAAVASRPAADVVVVPPPVLHAHIQASADVGWSGMVESLGSLQVPDSDSFASLASLLGERNELRVWWRGPQEWRIDRVRSTGETDLFRQRSTLIRWVFESQTATITPVSTIRLPDASDLLPPTLARALLQGARNDELSPLPARRVAGLNAPGLRLTPRDPAATVERVDIWADLESGLPLRVELYAAGQATPVLSAEVRELNRTTPPAAATHFNPGSGVSISYEESVDVAAAANAFAPYDLPVTLADLRSRSGEDPGAVGIYGRGPTTLIALPLRDQVAWPLRERLRDGAAARETDVGVVTSVGPVGMLLTSPLEPRGPFLLAGMVTPQTLERAAAQLLAGP